MGDTISTLVFRPPRPTYLKPTKYFFLDVNQNVPIARSLSSMTCGAADTAACSSGGGAQSCQPPPPSGGRHRIPAFFIKRQNARLTMLFSHGNAEDLGMMYDRLKTLSRELNVNIMCYDYTGYGYSTGTPTEEMCYRNIETAYSYLRNMLGIPASQIFLYGRSLGSGPSCYLAAKVANEGDSLAGLILHSPFLSIYRIVVNSQNLGVVGDMFPNGLNVRDVRCPVMIIHGTTDEIVPFSHGLELLSNVPEQYRALPLWAEGLGHNNIEVVLKELYLSRCRHFIDRYVSGAQDNGGQSLIVPMAERAIIDPSDLSQHQFYINPTWLAFGKKVLNQAIGTSQHDVVVSRTSSSDSSSCGDRIDSRDDDDCLRDGGPSRASGDWNSDGTVREDWPDYESVKVSLIKQEGRDESETSRDADHANYFQSCGQAIADVAGTDESSAALNAEVDRKMTMIQMSQSKKGRKLLNRIRHASS